jgi:hypothetical protein
MENDKIGGKPDRYTDNGNCSETHKLMPPRMPPELLGPQ